jgi:subtilisin family serine protease
MRIDELHKGLLAGISNSANPRVNVVIIDQGLNKEAILAAHRGNWGGGWKAKGRHPGKADRRSHGMLIARNVLDIAPDAVLYDVPLIPKPVISSVPVFASNAHAVYDTLFAWIRVLRNHHRWAGPWVFVNAWAIYDRSSETPLGDYTEDTNSTDPQSPGHRLNTVIANAARYEKIDVVFAAGNCGTFCPASRCGKLDRGPGRSIWGGNSSSYVITAGAVLTNETWLGYSSQGPGQQRLGSEKPDFCAPSVFAETMDAHVLNTGTSTASALTAGVVAALRQGWDTSLVSPQVLRQTLIATARKVQGTDWSERWGYGVLNAAAAFEELSTAFGRPQAGAAQNAPAAPPVLSPIPAAPAEAIGPPVQPIGMRERGWLGRIFASVRSFISRLSRTGRRTGIAKQ